MKKILVAVSILVVAFFAFMKFGRSIWVPIYTQMKGRETVKSIVHKIGNTALNRLQPDLTAAGFKSLPHEIALVAIKQDQILEVWGKLDSEWMLIKKYPFTAYSGKPGPKLREGDKQIPEGIYEIEYLNPNSLFYLSMKVSYPNEFDKEKATEDGRSDIGTDIFIHGKDNTVGCIPIGDKAIEEVFVLASKTIENNIRVVISPVDFRLTNYRPSVANINWEEELYTTLEKELKKFSQVR